MSDTRFYRGQGHREPKMADALPTVDFEALRRPEDYRATPELAAAVDVALTLGMPLLLTGEPGSGKSGLADSLAWELGLGEPLRFPVKSDTESRDRFYRFDTVGRFHAAQARPPAGPAAYGAENDAGDRVDDRVDANVRDLADAGRFIAFEALGQAILHAKPPGIERELRLPPRSLRHPGTPRRSVVLIDEIDKAPRDVPNDILVEIERMELGIPELSGAGRELVRVALAPDEARYRPVVVFTSNSEKALPDPFLRRCVYHHLSFPPFDADLMDAEGKLPEDRVTVDTIVAARLGARFQRKQQAEAGVADALDFFRMLRGEGLGLTRRPTLAELLDWLDHLMPQRLPPSAWVQLAALRATPGSDTDRDTEQRLLTGITSLLLKRPADKARAPTLLAQWRQTPAGRQ